MRQSKVKLGSPFGDTPVVMAPHWVVPVYVEFCAFTDVVDVNVDTETGAVRQVDVAIFVVEDRRVDEVVEDIIALVVVNVEALFLDERVRRDGIDLQTRRECNRPERAVWRHCHVVRFGHRRDFVSLP